MLLPAFGALVVATGLERDPARAQLVDDHLDALVATLTLLGAAPVVVVHDGTPRVNPPARDLRMPRAERDDLSALRVGLVQFANAPVGAALVLSIEEHATDPLFLRRMMDECTRRALPLAATAAGGALGFPLYATRDIWRELLTTEGGLESALRHPPSRLLVLEPE